MPTQAITMGVGTILEARKIVLMAFGEHKAGIIREAVEGPLTDRVPASFLREHADAVVAARRGRRRRADRAWPRPGCWATSSGPTR